MRSLSTLSSAIFDSPLFSLTGWRGAPALWQSHLLQSDLLHDPLELRADLSPLLMQPAGVLITALPRPENASRKQIRTLEGLKDLAQADLAGWPGQGITPHGAPMGGDQLVASELLEDLGEEARWKVARPGDVLQEHDLPFFLPRQHAQGLQSILALST